MATIAGKLLPLEFSTDEGVTWERLDCLITSPFRSTKSTTREQSQCGPHVASGEHSWGFDVEAIVETAPAVGRIGYSQLHGMHLSEAKPLVRMMNGTDLHIEGNVLVADFGVSNPVEGLARFTARLEGDGAYVIAA